MEMQMVINLFYVFDLSSLALIDDKTNK